MWPDYDEIDATTEPNEWALEQAYHAALANWLYEITVLILPEFEGGAMIPPDLDAITGSESLAIWNEQFDIFVAPALAMIWSYAYARAAWAFNLDMTNPALVAGIGPDGEWDGKGKRPSKPYIPPVEPWDDPNAPPREPYTGPAAVNTDPKDFSQWLERTRDMQKRGSVGNAPSPPLEVVRHGPVSERPAPLPPGDRTSAEWVDANWPAPSPAPINSRVSGRDLVGRLVSLAWNTDPSQVKTTALMVWDQVSSRRKLEMFLGSYDPPVRNSIPGRVRDLLVGSTNDNSRRAIPMGEFRDELGMWLRTAISQYGGRSTSTLHRRGHPNRQSWVTEADVIRSESHGAFYERDFEPGPPRPALDFWRRFRDVAHSSGLEAAGIINQGMLNAASQSGVEFDKVWVSHMDRRTRDTHYVADGQRAGVDGTFLVGGAHLAYPGDPSAPAGERRNCRCRVGMTDPGKPLPPEIKRNSAQKNEIIHRQRLGLIRAREDPNGIGIIPLDPSQPITASAEQESAMTDFRTFTDAVIAVVGTPTSDGRMLSSDIDLSFRDFPLPLMWTKQSSQGHLDAFTVGVLESARVDDGKVLASGYMLNSPEADEAADQIAHGVTAPSVDLAAAEWVMTDQAGGELCQTITKAELIGTTLVATPAFGVTRIALNTMRESRDVALVAAAAEDFRPRVYDHRLFENPNLPGPTLPTMGDDGRIYGHLACFGQCHRSIQSECVIAPRSRSEYAHFHTSPAVRLDNGQRLPVGRLTVGTGHAPSHARPGAAAAHYDNTGTCFALVRVGEDAHGIWFSGVAAPWATPEQIEMGLSSPLSGDWRDFGSGLELVAALAVNTPGFSARGRSDEQGRPIALVAALGPVATEDIQLTYDTVKDAVKDALAEAARQQEQDRLAAERDALLARAAEITHPPTPGEEIAELLSRR